MNNQINKKDTTADDSASIYQQRDEKSEKQKLSEMNFKEKVTYFNNYYRTKTIIGLIIAAIVISTAYTVLAPKPKTILYAAIVNNVLDDTTADTLEKDFGKKININPKTQNVYIDTSFYVGTDNDMSEYAAASQQKLQTYLFAAQLDVIIAPESKFAQYAQNGALSKLSDSLPTDLCSTLADSFYSSTTTDDKNSSAYGIYLDNAPIFSKYGKQADRPILGIAVNTKNNQNAVEFVRYLFNLY